MNILLLGSGGREHALAWKIKQSSLCKHLFTAPGNPGTAELGTNIFLSLNDFESIEQFCQKENIELIVVGPEAPLVDGIYDYFSNSPIKVFGPSKEGAKLEGSKDYAKRFMNRHNIPTAAYQSFTKENIEEGYSFLESLNAPYVLKADGLAGGKGVLIIETLKEAKSALKNMLEDAQFGTASKCVVIEEFMKGIEISVFAITNGTEYKIIGNAKDYKRIGEKDTGLNTGGMGAVSPVPFADYTFMKKVEDRVVAPSIQGLKLEGISYKGIVYFGLMNIDGDPKVVEYNVRLGDPEAEILLPRLKNDIVELILSCFDNTLENHNINFDPRAIATIIMVSGGYPESYNKGFIIKGLEKENQSLIFHAGTKEDSGQIITSGGRVLAITSYGASISDATKKSYSCISNIDFENAYFRKDIGFDLV